MGGNPTPRGVGGGKKGGEREQGLPGGWGEGGGGLWRVSEDRAGVQVSFGVSVTWNGDGMQVSLSGGSHQGWGWGAGLGAKPPRLE